MMAMTDVDVRARLVEALEADLVGPFLAETSGGSGGDEVLTLPPSRWYLTGFLAPKGGQEPAPDDASSVDETLGAGSDEQADDEGQEEIAPKRPLFFPASMGLSVFLPPGAGDSLSVGITYADYTAIDEPGGDGEKPRIRWKRDRRAALDVNLPIDRDILTHPRGIELKGTRGLVLRGALQETEISGLPKRTRVLSLFIVNERQPQEQHSDEQFAFQVKLTLRYEPGFLSRPNRRGAGSTDPDQRVLALTFREYKEWAVGHNTSVKTPIIDGGKVSVLSTTQVPSCEVPQVKHREVNEATTAMQDLAKLDGPALRNALSPLVDAYDAWISQQSRVPLGDDDFDRTRDDLLIKATRAKKRMHEGIELLATDDELRKAFHYANQAMYRAAIQADTARQDPRYGTEKKPEWRIFQLAFILMNIASMANHRHDDRKVVELIYFPTGGGKTEAYLGLIAFALALRRLRGKDSAHQGRGVAIILRYTMRLLTLDQLGRAATLICALETLREKHPEDLGHARFTIGLWVGKKASPNKLQELYDILFGREQYGSESPFPLANCPWCAEPIEPKNIKLVDGTGKPAKKNFERACVYCNNAQCPFTEHKRPGEGLPVSFVDEQIYTEAPSFIVATVDKFSMTPWLANAGALFGRVTHADDRRVYTASESAPKAATPLPDGFLPPELIVQDELHLISGPLGTMVGLFEAAVEYLCEHPRNGETRAPKIICSTATLRRASEQIRGIFGRQAMDLFPPRGITEGDNFFSQVDTTRAGRLYVGVGAPGRALRAVSVRAYATLLAAGQKHFDPQGPPEQAADPYMTLVGYFNSLRELGGMRRLVESEVLGRVKYFAKERRPQGFEGPHPWAANRQLQALPAELTSRLKTGDIKKTKDRLGARRMQLKGAKEPIDVVLASTMISVGLDIDRLGLMVITGQPKTTSEYIQASSRVGRAYAGLVVTCLNVMRPRDRSHYERFSSFHESFYRDVEATSVTPFSGQALDRGLHATIVTMVRHAITEMEPPLGFMKLREHRPEANRILDWLISRATSHKSSIDADAERRIADLLRDRGSSFLDSWQRIVDRAVSGSAKRKYYRYDVHAADSTAVLFNANEDAPVETDEQKFKLPTSMRDVEPSTHLWITTKQLDERR